MADCARVGRKVECVGAVIEGAHHGDIAETVAKLVRVVVGAAVKCDWDSRRCERRVNGEVVVSCAAGD